ncbi:MAG: hypothetical protein HZA32_20730 [Opitutae bacterium]|nr:hypothetical protein [Opitutae bacterium]
MTGADLLALVKKQPIAFACGLLALLCGVALYFRSDAVDEAQRLFEEKDKESQKIALNARHTTGLAEQVQEIQAGAKQLESRLVHAGDLANNLQFFYRLENETGVKLIDVRQNSLPTPKANAPKTLFIPVSFSLTLQGSYAQVWAFIRRVETGPHFVRFDRLTVSKLEGAGRSEAGVGAGLDQMNAVFTVELLGTP